MNAARILRYARRRSGLSQRALASASGVPQPAIARIERGAVSPRLSTLTRLLEAAGTTMEVEPALGTGVDRTLIRSTLAMTPEQRILAAGVAGTNLAAFRAATKRGRRS